MVKCVHSFQEYSGNLKGYPRVATIDPGHVHFLQIYNWGKKGSPRYVVLIFFLSRRKRGNTNCLNWIDEFYYQSKINGYNKLN